jgi:hypothetical protein
MADVLHQAIDADTQAFLDSLPTARVLLLVNYRPEYQHAWGSKTYYSLLRLDPLPPASAGELLQALLGEDASQLLAEVYGWFTGGLDMADLQEAQALLGELS